MKKRKRLDMDMLEDFSSKIFDNAKPNLFKEVMIDVIKDAFEPKNYEHKHRQSKKKIFVFGDENLIN